MADFVSQALEEMLHPKQQMGGTMENNRTIAFHVCEERYRRIKDYLMANHLTQKEFMIGLIEDALEQEITEEEAEKQECDERRLAAPAAAARRRAPGIPRRPRAP